MTLNELLVEWSYRTEKGYPDLGNPSDILILEEILESLDLPLEEIIPNLKEGTKAANTRKAIDIILQSKYFYQKFLWMRSKNSTINMGVI